MSAGDQDDGLAGILAGERVLFVKGLINKRTMHAFIESYHRAVGLGIIKPPKEKE